MYWQVISSFLIGAIFWWMHTQTSWTSWKLPCGSLINHFPQDLNQKMCIISQLIQLEWDQGRQRSLSKRQWELDVSQLVCPGCNFRRDSHLEIYLEKALRTSLASAAGSPLLCSNSSCYNKSQTQLNHLTCVKPKTWHNVHRSVKGSSPCWGSAGDSSGICLCHIALRSRNPGCTNWRHQQGPIPGVTVRAGMVMVHVWMRVMTMHVHIMHVCIRRAHLRC